MKIIPLYHSSNLLLIGLKEDYIQEPVNDGLVIKIDIETRRFEDAAWSLQKMLKFGYFDSISENEREGFLLKIKEAFSLKEIKELEDSLLNPSKESIESLIWLPERLKNRKEGLTHEANSEIKKTLESLVKIRHELFQDALNYAMKHELKDINEVFDVGDTYEFGLSHLDGSNDANLQLLVDLVRTVERTAESLANLNKIDLDEFDK